MCALPDKTVADGFRSAQLTEAGAGAAATSLALTCHGLRWRKSISQVRFPPRDGWLIATQQNPLTARVIKY